MTDEQYAALYARLGIISEQLKGLQAPRVTAADLALEFRHPQSLALTTTTAALELQDPNRVRYYIISSATAVFYRLGPASVRAVADGTSHYLPAGVDRFIKAAPGESAIAAIVAAGTATLYVSEVIPE